ncbi:MAG: DUF371 domain-containing protein [Methanobacteriota archaeon]
MIESITAIGHSNVTANHKTTLMFTKEDYLTPSGDCIIAIKASKGCVDLSERFKDNLRDGDARLKVIIECGGISEIISASGRKELILTHPADMVIRKSGFICPRTLAINSDKAAVDLDVNLIKEIAKGSPVLINLEIDKVNQR